MRSPNDMFCLIWKRWAWKDFLASHLDMPTTTVSNILKKYCEQEWIEPTRDTLTTLWNTIFDGKTLATKLLEDLPVWWTITWLRMPETLYHLMKQQRCLLIWVLSDDYLRRQRVTQRKRAWDVMPYRHFLEHERQENTLPNKQNIDMLLAFCDTYITNNDSLENLTTTAQWALTKALTRKASTHHIDASGYMHFTRAILINEYDEVLVLYDIAKQLYTLPWWKCDTGETPDITIQRELKEEINIDISPTYCGSFPWLFRDGLGKGHFFEWIIEKGSVCIKEPDKHAQLTRIPRNKLQLQLWFTTFLDTWLYHYMHDRRIHTRDFSRDYDMDRTNGVEYIQYMNPYTRKLHIAPWHGTLDPCCIPIRIMTHDKIHEGLWAQKQRMG